MYEGDRLEGLQKRIITVASYALWTALATYKGLDPGCIIDVSMKKHCGWILLPVFESLSFTMVLYARY